MPVVYDFSKMYWAEDNHMSWPDDYETFFAGFGLPYNTLVHVGHCTVNGGCKYGDKFCPIETGKVKPVFFTDDEGELDLIRPKRV